MTVAYSSAFQLQVKGTLIVALSGMLFGFMGFLGTKLLNLNLSLESMLFWRFLVATVWVVSCMLMGKTSTRKLNCNGVSLFKIFILSAISYSGCSGFYFMASQQIGTGLAMVIFFSFPVFVALFSWVLGNWKINKFAFAALIAVVLGLILLKGQGQNELNVIGIIFAIISAVSYAMYVYGSQHTIKNIDASWLTLIVCLGNTIIFLFLSWYTNSFVMPTTVAAWAYICAIGIIATALPIQLLLYGLKYISPVKASIVSVLEPVVTILVGLALLDETMTSMQALGVLIILSGAILIQFEERSPFSSNKVSGES